MVDWRQGIYLLVQQSILLCFFLLQCVFLGGFIILALRMRRRGTKNSQTKFLIRHVCHIGKIFML